MNRRPAGVDIHSDTERNPDEIVDSMVRFVDYRRGSLNAFNSNELHTTETDDSAIARDAHT